MKPDQITELANQLKEANSPARGRSDAQLAGELEAKGDTLCIAALQLLHGNAAPLTAACDEWLALRGVRPPA